MAVDVPDCALATPCAVERIYVHDGAGTTVVDSAPAGSGQQLTGLTLNGDRLSWSNDGAPHTMTLP